jgi:endonuclease-8
VPEGDTVWRAARRLHAALAGEVLRGSDFRVPRLATADLSGQRITEVASRGKHLLTRFDGGLTLHTHFGMEGSWHLHRPGTPAAGGPAWQIRAVLTTSGRAATGYRLVTVELVPTDQEQDVVGHLGPDLLGPDWDLDTAVARLRARPETQIGAACSTSACWRGSATSGEPRPVSSRASPHGRPWATYPTFPDSCVEPRR